MGKLHAFALSTAIAVITAPAFAGSLADPIATPVIMTPAPAPAANWTGGYGGILLGYGSGEAGNGTNFTPDGNADWDGGNFGLVGGYNVQRGKMVYGGELTYSGSSVSGTEPCFNPAFTCYAEIESIASLRGRFGYLVKPDTMVYGTLGVTQARINFATENAARLGETKSVSGYVVGIGVERAFTPTINARAALNYYEFDSDQYQTDTLYLNMGGSMTELEFGLVYRF